MQDDFFRCVRFAENWYGHKDKTPQEILKKFSYERLSIGNHLTPHIDEKIVNEALDEFKDRVRLKILSECGENTSSN